MEIPRAANSLLMLGVDADFAVLGERDGIERLLPSALVHAGGAHRHSGYGNAGDGKTLTMDQATRRWLVIAAPGILAQVVWVVPALGALIGLVAFGWFIYLLWTTYSSPTKQGFHDKFANTMVVKAARTAG